MDNEFNNDKIDTFDVEQAEKLLESIRFISDLRKFPVQKPNSTNMEMTTMQEWVKWYAKTTEWNGKDGTESEVMRMIENIDSDLQIMIRKVEDGFRILLTVSDRKDLKISLLSNEVEKYKEELRLIKLSSDKKSYNEETKLIIDEIEDDIEDLNDDENKIIENVPEVKISNENVKTKRKSAF